MKYTHMGWLQLVGSIKSQVSFAKETYKRDYSAKKTYNLIDPTDRSHRIAFTPYGMQRTVAAHSGITSKWEHCIIMYKEYMKAHQNTHTFVDGYCSTVQGLLDWFEVDLGFTELSFIQRYTKLHTHAHSLSRTHTHTHTHTGQGGWDHGSRHRIVAGRETEVS